MNKMSGDNTQVTFALQQAINRCSQKQSKSETCKFASTVRNFGNALVEHREPFWDQLQILFENAKTRKFWTFVTNFAKLVPSDGVGLSLEDSVNILIQWNKANSNQKILVQSSTLRPILDKLNQTDVDQYVIDFTNENITQFMTIVDTKTFSFSKAFDVMVGDDNPQYFYNLFHTFMEDHELSTLTKVDAVKIIARWNERNPDYAIRVPAAYIKELGNSQFTEDELAHVTMPDREDQATTKLSYDPNDNCKEVEVTMDEIHFTKEQCRDAIAFQLYFNDVSFLDSEQWDFLNAIFGDVNNLVLMNRFHKFVSKIFPDSATLTEVGLINAIGQWNRSLSEQQFTIRVPADTIARTNHAFTDDELRAALVVDPNEPIDPRVQNAKVVRAGDRIHAFLMQVDEQLGFLGDLPTTTETSQKCPDICTRDMLEELGVQELIPLGGTNLQNFWNRTIARTFSVAEIKDLPKDDAIKLANRRKPPVLNDVKNLLNAMVEQNVAKTFNRIIDVASNYVSVTNLDCLVVPRKRTVKQEEVSVKAKTNREDEVIAKKHNEACAAAAQQKTAEELKLLDAEYDRTRAAHANKYAEYEAILKSITLAKNDPGKIAGLRKSQAEASSAIRETYTKFIEVEQQRNKLHLRQVNCLVESINALDSLVDRRTRTCGEQEKLAAAHANYDKYNAELKRLNDMPKDKAAQFGARLVELDRLTRESKKILDEQEAKVQHAKDDFKGLYQKYVSVRNEVGEWVKRMSKQRETTDVIDIKNRLHTANGILIIEMIGTKEMATCLRASEHRPEYARGFQQMQCDLSPKETKVAIERFLVLQHNGNLHIQTTGPRVDMRTSDCTVYLEQLTNVIRTGTQRTKRKLYMHVFRPRTKETLRVEVHAMEKDDVLASNVVIIH